jgi:5-methyltetrahydrofolate--homocysteine methyltransferase
MMQQILLDFAENVKGDVKVMKKAIQEWRSGTIQRRRYAFIVKGVDEFIEIDVEEATQQQIISNRN